MTSLPSVEMSLLQHSASKSHQEADRARVHSASVQYLLARPLLLAMLSSESEETVSAAFTKINRPDRVASVGELKLACRIIQTLFDNFVAEVPAELLDEGVMCLLEKSKKKVACLFLSGCLARIPVDSVREELALLGITPVEIMKFQVLGA